MERERRIPKIFRLESVQTHAVTVLINQNLGSFMSFPEIILPSETEPLDIENIRLLYTANEGDWEKFRLLLAKVRATPGIYSPIDGKQVNHEQVRRTTDQMGKLFFNKTQENG